MMSAPDQYGVVGHPVSHSRSPFIHSMFARDTGQRLSYRAYDVAPAEFAPWVREFFAHGGRGLNVTLPHKLAAAALAQQLTPRAARAGAVNTLAAQAAGILGDNTDGAGLIRDLCDNLGVGIAGRRVLIMGVGGATRGLLGPLLEFAPAEVLIVNRTAERTAQLAAAFADLGSIRGAGFEEIERRPFDLVINATSASLSGVIPPLPAGLIGAHTVCYELAYGRSATAFLDWALSQGCAQAVPGLGMLVEQAAESFQLWRGVRPATAAVLAALRQRDAPA